MTYSENERDVAVRCGYSLSAWGRLTDQERTDALMARVRRDAQKREWRNSMPDEPYRREDDTEEPVVWFQKTFGKESERGEPMPPVYTYVAFRLGPNAWEFSKDSQRVFTWPEIWEFAALREYSAPTIWRATEWEVVS